MPVVCPRLQLITKLTALSLEQWRVAMYEVDVCISM